MSYPPQQPGYPPPGGGYPPQGGFAPPVSNPTNGLAIAALITGILTIVTCIFPLGLVAAILGFVALGKAKKLNGSGKGMAIGGIVTGLIGLVSGSLLVFGIFLAADAIDDPSVRCGSDEISNEGFPCRNQGDDDPTPGDSSFSDPADQVCNVDRYIEDPDC